MVETIPFADCRECVVGVGRNGGLESSMWFRPRNEVRGVDRYRASPFGAAGAIPGRSAVGFTCDTDLRGGKEKIATKGSTKLPAVTTDR